MEEIKLFLEGLIKNNVFIMIIIMIIFDTIFGVLRAIKEKKLNSCVGIDGIIRKTGMLFSSFFFFLIDNLLKLNVIGFIPEQVKELVNIEKIGMGELFGILFIIFEFLSIMKNMYKCKLPIPIKLQKWLEKILSDYTEEIKKGELENGKEESSSKESTEESNSKENTKEGK